MKKKLLPFFVVLGMAVFCPGCAIYSLDSKVALQEFKTPPRVEIHGEQVRVYIDNTGLEPTQVGSIRVRAKKGNLEVYASIMISGITKMRDYTEKIPRELHGLDFKDRMFWVDPDGLTHKISCATPGSPNQTKPGSR